MSCSTNSINNIKLKTFVCLSIVIIFYFCTFVAQSSMGILSHDLMRDFSANASQLGLISVIFFYSYAILQLPAGLLLDKFGIEKTLVLSMLFFALGLFIFMLSTNLFVACLARFIMGAAAAFAFIGALFWGNCWFPVRSFALIAGITEMMGAVGAIFGNTPWVVAIK